MNIKWISVTDKLPPDETPVLIWFNTEWVRIGELRWETPSFEETFQPFQYWDCPYDDGRGWDWFDITHWAELPEPPVP